MAKIAQCRTSCTLDALVEGQARNNILCPTVGKYCTLRQVFVAQLAGRFGSINRRGRARVFS
jgi:hypothetical protein